MDKIDQIELENGNEKFVAYILGEVKYNNSVYIYYVRDLKEDYTFDDIYVGKLENNYSVSSVSDEVMSFLEEKLREIIH